MADDVAAAEQEAGGVLALVDRPGEVLTDQKRFDDFFERIAAEARGLKADVGTKRGREAIASMAYRISRTKTALDEAGKKLTEDARARIQAVDRRRRDVRERLDSLRDEVRQPLNAWEEAEAARVARVDAAMNTIADAARIAIDDTAASVRERLAAIENMEFPNEEFLDEVEAATAARDRTVAVLQQGLARLVQQEAERAELARLRAQEEARQAEERRRAEEEEARQREAARVEEERQAAERAARERQEAIARAAREAEERVAREAAERAAEAEAARQREHEESLAAERRAREAAEAEARQERERREAEERQRADAARRQQEEDSRRAADREHRGKVMRTAKEALIEHTGIDEDAAKKVVLAIAAGSVPAVTIRF